MGVFVPVSVALLVDVAVGVSVGLEVELLVRVGVIESVGLKVAVWVDDEVGLSVAVKVGVFVGVWVGLEGAWGVGEMVGVHVKVGVAVPPVPPIGFPLSEQVLKASIFPDDGSTTNHPPGCPAPIEGFPAAIQSACPKEIASGSVEPMGLPFELKKPTSPASSVT